MSLQNDLYYLESWSSTWKLRFNESKCAGIRMCLGEPKSNHPISGEVTANVLSPVWRAQLVKDILRLEKVQRRATKYILNDYTADYRSRLQSLNLLPLMYQFEINDIMFCVQSLQTTSILKIFLHINHHSNKMVYSIAAKSMNGHFYFNRLPRLWNAIPPVDLTSCRTDLIRFLRNHFNNNFNPLNPCTFHFLYPCFKCSHNPTPPF